MKKTVCMILIIAVLLAGFCWPSAVAVGLMSLTVSTVSGEAGDTVEVDIVIADNPGIASLKFDVEYADCLTLEGVTFNSAFGPYATTPPVYSNPQRITLISPFSECTVNGVLATLTFKIADDAPAGEYEISLSYIQSETYNTNFEDVAVTVANGSVIVGEGGSSEPEDPIPPAPDGDTMLLTASKVAGVSGDSVTVDISIADNPGIASLKFEVAYDSALILENVEFNTAFGPYATTPLPYGNPQTVTLLSPFADVTVNGVFATLTFKIADGAAEGEYEIALTCVEDETYDSNFEDVKVTAVNGSVTVEKAPFDFTYGDISGEGKITALDLSLLNAYLKGKINFDARELAAADIDRSGSVTDSDFEALKNYLLE